MELFEKINRAFGSWYEGLFGGGDDVRPKDILRRILTALEEHRKEGFDNRVYVPNQYILEIAVDDEEEKEYLLSFLDREELETAIRRYCHQNGYQVRGRLDFTIREVEPEAGAARRQKVRVRCRYDSKLAAEKPPVPAAVPRAAPRPVEEDPTVFDAAGDSEPGTVPAVAAVPATLIVQTPGRPAFEQPLTGSPFSIGRSARAGNDLVLAEDGMASRRHALIELDADGRFTLYDLGTTNGTRVNGQRVDNRTLSHGDEIVIGATRIRFHQPGLAAASAGRGAAARPARLVSLQGELPDEDYILASETLIGRGVTNDIVLADRSVAIRHARIRRGQPFTIESLDPSAPVTVNGQLVAGGPHPLADQDRITLGAIHFRFEDDSR